MTRRFFLAWELWQQMTFILACSIVIVFALGFTKQWWTNRSMRKLELLDVEKRARRSDVQRCGVDSLLVNDIPFGVRAIQRGIQVDGIWISSSNPPDLSHDLSHVASSTTLIGESTTSVKPREASRLTTSRHASQDQTGSAISAADEGSTAEPSSTLQPGIVPPTCTTLNPDVPSSIEGRSPLKRGRPAVRRHQNLHRPEMPHVSPINPGKENMIRGGVISRKGALRSDEHRHQSGQTIPESSTGMTARPVREAADDMKEGAGNRRDKPMGHLRRSRRKRVSRTPLVVYSR